MGIKLGATRQEREDTALYTAAYDSNLRYIKKKTCIEYMIGDKSIAQC